MIKDSKNYKKQCVKIARLKSVSDNGWGAFVEVLGRKCEEYGHVLVRVDKWFPSSKTCSCCGYVKKGLQKNERTYICPMCGNTMDRDEQAAINIDRESMSIFEKAFIDTDTKKTKGNQNKGCLKHLCLAGGAPVSACWLQGGCETIW